MKMLLLAVVAASLWLPVAPVLAQDGAVFTRLPEGGLAGQVVERRSGRCPGGERRFFVFGCGGV